MVQADRFPPVTPVIRAGHNGNKLAGSLYTIGYWKFRKNFGSFYVYYMIYNANSAHLVTNTTNHSSNNTCIKRVTYIVVKEYFAFTTCL